MKKNELIAKERTQFLRWLLQEKEIGLKLGEHDTVIKVPDIFGVESKQMAIDLTNELCTDSEKLEHSIDEYFALVLGRSLEYIRHDWKVRKREQYQEQKNKELEHIRYQIDESSLAIYDLANDARKVTDYLIELESIIETENIQTGAIEREIVGKITYYMRGSVQVKEFSLSPEETFDHVAFSKAIWNYDFLKTHLKNRDELQDLFIYLERMQKPKIVTTVAYTGYFKHKNRYYYIAKNVIVECPNEFNNFKTQLIELDEDGTFHIGSNQYLVLDKQIKKRPVFELDPAVNGRYLTNERQLLQGQDLDKHLKVIEGHLGGMVGGTSDFSNWGKVSLGYVFQFLFQDVIKHTFQHGVFLYIYGAGNAGKGQYTGILNSFFGASIDDRLNDPTQAAADSQLMLYKDRPMVIDEFKPDGYSNNKIPDQTLNGWFQWDARVVLMMNSDKRVTAEKFVGTMILFVSNYLPITDHFTSRCLVLEYSAHRRGPEKHLTWLKDNTAGLQLAFLSMLNMRHTISDKLYMQDLIYFKSELGKLAKAQLRAKTGLESINLVDRQIEMWAIQVVSYQWLNSEYREFRTKLYDQQKKAESSKTHGSYQPVDMSSILTNADQPLIKFAVDQLVYFGIKSLDHSPIAVWLQTVGYLIQKKEILEYKHYNWIKKSDGYDLAVNAGSVAAIYKAHMRGQENVVTDEVVRREFADRYQAMKEDGSLRSIRYTDMYSEDSSGNKKVVSYKGYRVAAAKVDEMLAIAFAHPRLDTYIEDDGDNPSEGEYGSQKKPNNNNDFGGQFDLPY